VELNADGYLERLTSPGDEPISMIYASSGSLKEITGSHRDQSLAKKNEPPKELSVEDYDSKTRGALQVKAVRPSVGDCFIVEKGGKGIGGVPPVLNSTVELDPGEYVVSVNRTSRKVTIEAGKKAILRAGEVVVEGKEGAGGWYNITEGKEGRGPTVPPGVGGAVSLFAGRYNVIWSEGAVGRREDFGEVEVKVGERTTLRLR
jgi:hypothetical protein